MDLTLENIKGNEGMEVIDNKNTSYGIGSVDRVKDGLVYVWYDEVETMVHYKEDQLNLLTKL